MERIKAPIDNKNLMEDPFEDEVFCDGFLQAADHRKGGKRHLVGTKKVKDDKGFTDAMGIVDVKWSYGDNCVTITILAIDGVATSYDWEEYRRMIFDDYRREFKSWECPENENLVVDFYELGNMLNVIFYWEVEN